MARRAAMGAGWLVGVLLAVCGGAAAQDVAGAWTQAPALPTPRSEMKAAALDGRVYVPGGLGPQRTLGVLEWFDPEAEAWASGAPLPEPVHHPGVTAAAGRLLVMGGYTGLNFDVDHDAVWAYDPAEDAWERLPDMPAPRAAHVLATVDGVVHVIGGVGPDAREVWRFDADAETWLEPAAPLPTPREHLAVAVLDGRIYAIAGRVPGRGNVGTVEVFDPAENAWSAAPDLPTPRSGLTAAAVEERIHVVGGEDLGSSDTFGAHEVLEPAAGTWSQAPRLDPPRHGLASAVVDGGWYVLGGATEAGGGTFGSLTSVVNVWRTRAP